MTKLRTAAMIATSLGLAMGITIGQMVYAPTTATAADAKKTVGPKVLKPLQEAIAASKAGKFPDALSKAQEAEKVAGKTPYETYVVEQIIASIYAQMKDYPNAVKAMEAEQATGEMSPQESKTALKQIAESYYSLRNYPKVIEAGGKYLTEVDANDVDMLMMVAQAQYLQKNFRAASDGIRAAIKTAQADNNPVKEDWLHLLVNCEQQQSNDAGTITALEQLISVDPKEEYWKNLIAYTERSPEFKNNSSTRAALDLDFLKFTVGALTTPQEYADMADLAFQNGLPGAARKVLDKGTSAGVLGQSTQDDREKRLSALVSRQSDSDQKALAAGEAEALKAKTGDPLVGVGEAYWSYGQYDKAVDAIQAGIAKGVTNADDAKLRLGIVYLADGKRSEAADDFRTITPDSVPGKLSALWMLAYTSPPPSTTGAPEK